jgi:uncharacterized protein with von Willebrand factor type A (vWA) domain
MALAELITTRYPKDTLDILVFGNDAWPIAIKDLPFKVGPCQYSGWFTTCDGFTAEKTYTSKFLLTDGKPSCVRKKTDLII